MNRITKAAVTLAAGSVLALGVTDSAFAATGATNLAGKGCPATASNKADGGTYYQTRYGTYLSGGGVKFGEYHITFVNGNGVGVSRPDKVYTC